MIATVHKGGASFKGVVDYCLSEGRAREDARDERGEDKDGRVEWSETRNVQDWPFRACTAMLRPTSSEGSPEVSPM